MSTERRWLKRACAAAGWRFQGVAGTIRGKIVLAFCAFAVITGGLGAYAVNSVVDAGHFVVATYDKPLMAISYARLALADFQAVRLAYLERLGSHDEDRVKALDVRIAELGRSIAEALAVAEDRALSERAATASRNAEISFAAWSDLGREILAGPDRKAVRRRLEPAAAGVVEALDTLAELTAEDGFRFRARALAAIGSYRRVSVAATALALLLSIVVALLLARRMVQPIAAASLAAERIAGGELDVAIAPAGRDELGRLLGSMAAMRDNIRDMMRREVAARRSAEAQLVAAIESSKEGVVLVDGAGRIVIANSQIARFFPDLARQLVAGASLPAILGSPADAVALPNGRWLRVSRSAAADGGGVVIVSDISGLKERETELRLAKDQAEAASRSKSQFLANMSHELRTPLNAIIGFSEVIRDQVMGAVSTRYQGYAGDINAAGRHLLEVINDVLDLSKVEIGRLELHEETVDLADVLAACRRIVADRAEAGQLQLVVEPSEAVLLHVDERRLKQIVINLLSNAVKFTPAGGRVSISSGVQRDGSIAITVADTGIGMRPEDVPAALEPFRQIDGALARRYEGTGLGLPLVQHLVLQHGGVLTIDTALGRGTAVTVTLPAERRLRAVA